MTPKEIVLGGYQSFSKGDLEGLGKIFHSDAIIKVNEIIKDPENTKVSMIGKIISSYISRQITQILIWKSYM